MPRGAHPGEFLARGIYGQYIYIDQVADAVIVVTGADRDFRNEGVHQSNVAMMRRIRDAL